VGLEGALHGHAHELGTPSHSHGFMAPQPAARLDRVSPGTGAHPAGTLGAVAVLQAEPGGSAAAGPSARSSPLALPPSLLSPILRI
jgi:hypothetical protein